MKKILVIISCLIILVIPTRTSAKTSESETSTNEITAESWIMGAAVLAAGGLAYYGNKLGTKLGKSNKKKK